MAELKYRGPGGNMTIRDAFPVRVVKSPVFLSVVFFITVIWSGSYLYRYDRTPFLSTPLSLEHYNIRNKCHTCHSGFGSVPNDGCLSGGCHREELVSTIHNTIDQECIECHPEHLDGRSLPQSMKDHECADCHHLLTKDLESKFHPDNREKRHLSGVDRQIFSHKVHWYPVYECSACHCSGEGTINVPLKELFTMDACMKCHFNKDCQLCHQYHNPRLSRPLRRTCIDKGSLDKLRDSTRSCQDVFVEDLMICETGESAKKPSEPEIPPDQQE